MKIILRWAHDVGPSHGKLVENGKECEVAQMEEEDKVHDDSETEEVIPKPIAEHKGNYPLQTNSMKQGRWSFRKLNQKTLSKPYALWLKGNVPIEIQILLILLITKRLGYPSIE